MTPAVTQETITCAFCMGKGTDPYGLLSPLSRCEACGGMGQVVVMVPHVACAYCAGTGSHKTYRCLVCRGTGVVEPLPGPTEVCPECDGRACEPDSGLVCLRCKGRGLVGAEVK